MSAIIPSGRSRRSSSVFVASIADDVSISLYATYSVYEQPVVVQCVYVAVFAVGNHLHVTRTAQDCDAPAALFYQMTRGSVCGFHAVSGNGGVVLVGKGARHEHHGYVVGGQSGEMADVFGLLGDADYDAGHVQVAQTLHVTLLFLVAFVRVHAYNGIAFSTCGVLYAVENGRVEQRNPVGHDNADNR